MAEFRELFSQLWVASINTITDFLKLIMVIEERICKILWMSLSEKFNLEEVLEKIRQESTPLEEKEKLAIELLNYLYSFIPKDFQYDSEELTWYYGNNFHAFLYCFLQPEWKTSFFKKIYLERINSYQEGWEEFKQENEGMITKILEILKKREILGEVNKVIKEVLKQERKIKGLEEERIDTIDFYIKSKINPLLKEAAEKMRAKWIPFEKFF